MTDHTAQKMPYIRSLGQEYFFPKILFAPTFEEVQELTVANSAAKSNCRKKLS